MRTLLPLMKMPITPPAPNSSTDATSAERNGRVCSVAAGTLTSAATTASAIGTIATPPPRRIAQVSASRCSTDAMSCAR